MAVLTLPSRTAIWLARVTLQKSVEVPPAWMSSGMGNSRRHPRSLFPALVYGNRWVATSKLFDLVSYLRLNLNHVLQRFGCRTYARRTRGRSGTYDCSELSQRVLSLWVPLGWPGVCR
jgi:hypothetical protein